MELEAFLLDPAHYPLFGKPVEGVQSLGSIALAGCAPGSRMLARSDGTAIPLDAVVEAIHDGYRDGYVFQPLDRARSRHRWPVRISAWPPSAS